MGINWLYIRRGATIKYYITRLEIGSFDYLVALPKFSVTFNMVLIEHYSTMWINSMTLEYANCIMYGP